MILDHVAVLTRSIEQLCALNRLESDLPVEVFADSGSRERYIDADSHGGRLLLMQPHGPGPYQRAMNKRGPGLHHIGVATASLPAALKAWTDCGWQVHPDAPGTFLFQRGVPMLVELFEGLTDLPAPTTTVFLPVSADRLPAVPGIHCESSSATVRYRGEVLTIC